MFWRHVCYGATHLGLPLSLLPFCDPCLAAYIKSVLCPSLHVRGGDSTGPGTPVLRRFDIGLRSAMLACWGQHVLGWLRPVWTETLQPWSAAV